MEQQNLSRAPHPFWASAKRIAVGVVIGLCLIGAAYAIGRWA
jgi:F0F1-type ATP synthase membrane subunit c/vacuolar-type H+-ATPase subunit K